MKILTLILLISSALFSKVYYSKVEPYEIRDISSNVSGLVLYADENRVGKKLSSKAYIRIDSILDKAELAAISKKIVFIKGTIKSNEKILENLKESLTKKRDNYKKIESLKIKSRVEKDREFHDLINRENLYLNTQKEINNLKIQVTDSMFREAQLKRSIRDKNLSAKGFVLYSIAVKPGQVVGISTPLAKIADISRAKLTIYLDEVDVDSAKEMSVYINGEKTSYKITRLLSIADTKNISKYMAQIIIDAPKLFSKLVKVELRNE